MLLQFPSSPERSTYSTTAADSSARIIKMSTVRTRTAERLAAASNKSTEVNRSGELDHCKDKFKTFIEQFKPLKAVLKAYHAALVNVEHQRSEVLQQIELFTKETPLFPHAGQGNKLIQAAPSWAKTFQNKKEHSYCSMERQMSALNTQYADHVDEYCMQYVNEWEIVVTTRIQAGITKAEELKKTWLHYDKKVQQLTDADAKMTEKGKEPSASAKDKLKRNQEKLDVAKTEFDRYATSVCHLIDSALDCAWMDMTPIVYRLANMELDRMGGETNYEVFSKSLIDLVNNLKEFAEENDVNLTLPENAAKWAPSSGTTATAPANSKSKPTRSLSPIRKKAAPADKAALTKKTAVSRTKSESSAKPATTTKADVSKSDTTKPSSTGKLADKKTAETTTATVKPATTKPATTKAVATTKAATTKPAAAKPAATKPAATKPAAAKKPAEKKALAPPE